MSRSVREMSTLGPLMSISAFGRLTSTSGPSTLCPLNPNDGIFIFGILNPPEPSNSTSGPSMSTLGALRSPDISKSPFTFGPFRLKSMSGIEMFGPEIEGILNCGPLILQSGPSMSRFGPLMSPSILGTDTSKSPFIFGPFRLKSTSGMEIFGPETDGILTFGPLILPSGPSMSSSGPLMSTLGPLMSMSALGRLTSISGPSTLWPLNPNDGIFIFGIVNPPEPSISISGPSMFTLGALRSPSNLGTDTSKSPFAFGPFRLKSMSGIDIFGPDIEGILNFGPLILPSFPSMSISGPSMSMSALGRLTSTSGPSSLGPLNPNDGIFIFGILNPPEPSMSTSGPSMSTLGALRSPDISKSPFTFGPFRLKSTSGMEIFGPDTDGILNFGPLILPSGPSMSSSGPLMSPDISKSPFTFGPFRLKSTSGMEIFGPDTDGILNFGPLILPSGPSMSSSGPLMSPDISKSPFTFGPFRLKSTSGMEIFGPDTDGILNFGPLILPSGPSMSSSGPLMSTLGPLISMLALGRLTSTSGPSSLGPLNPNDGIFIFGILNPPEPSMSTSGCSMSTLGALRFPSILGTDTLKSPFIFGPFRLKSTSGIEIFGPDIDGILNFGPLILPSGPSMSSSGPSRSTLGPLISMLALGRLTSTSGPSSLGPLNPNDGIFIFGILNPPE
ncbi:hypothetical protein J4Q44_G00310170, partial [Coregonus suidteri]